nr:integrase, catalytic region, zinc finger, CCHC-type, peptidase aspartic, catalytic [Tanacetum cinerariifolium]
TLEIAEITRKKMNDKMNDPECVTRKDKISSHDYSKENFLATFTPQMQLTPEQIFWSNDLMKLKSEALKEQTKVSRPIKALTVLCNWQMQASLQGKDNVIRQLKKQLSQLQVTSSDTDSTLKVQTTNSQITKLTDRVTNLQAQNDLFRAKNDKIKQHYKELYDSIKITHSKHIKQIDPLSLPAVTLSTLRNYWHMRLALVPKALNNELNNLLTFLSLGRGCSKHMTRDRSRLMNFVKKFIGTVRFENDHFGAIMGYGDYVIGDNVISRVYYMEGLGHNLFSGRQFCDSDLEVAFRKHSCYVRDTDGVDLLKGSRGTNLYTILVQDMMKSSPILATSANGLAFLAILSAQSLLTSFWYCFRMSKSLW